MWSLDTVSAGATAADFDEDDIVAARTYLSEHPARNSIIDRAGIIAQYERELAAYHGRSYALLVNSGTSALYTAFHAVGIHTGDEIVAPVLTFPATVTPAVHLGARIRFVDIADESYNIDVTRVDEAITPRTKAIVFTNMWGYPANVPALKEAASRHGIPLIEDNSLSVGASLDGLLTGTQSDICCFSLGSTKLLSGGQGGALITDNPGYYENAVLLGHFGRLVKEGASLSERGATYGESGLGMNFRIHVLAAVVSRSRFKRFERLIAERKQRYAVVTSALSKCELAAPPVESPNVDRGMWQGYVAQIKSNSIVTRQRIYRALAAEDLPIQRGFYYKPLHLMRSFASVAGAFPRAEALHSTALSFPTFYREPLDDVRRFASALERALNEARL